MMASPFLRLFSSKTRHRAFAFPPTRARELPAELSESAQPAFTLIELMAASTVLSMVLLLMVGMQDQMSRAWSNANRRSDATREARSACRLMAEDLSCLVYRTQTFDNQNAGPAILNNNGIPFLFSSNGLGGINIPSVQPNSSYLFGLSARKANSGDIGIVGYYIAQQTYTNVNGFALPTYNLYRHYVPASNAINNLTAWLNTPFTSRTAGTLFNPSPSQDDVLARNTCNLKITFYNRTDGTTGGLTNRVQNGLNYQCVSAGNTTYYSGSKIQVELSVYPDDLAQKIPLADWGNSNNIKRFARSYEFRVDVPRD